MTNDSLFNTEEILQLLSLQADGNDRFIGQSHFMGMPNVFGGQALGQALYAASMTVEAMALNRRPHSLHALFILQGNYQLPITYEVERVRDGGTFSTRRVVALQEGKRIFVMSVSFQSEEQGLSHQKPAPTMNDPEQLLSSLQRWQRISAKNGLPFQPAPVDFRAEEDSDIFNATVKEPRRQVWVRAPQRLADTPLTHECLFAYASDYGLLWAALQPHGIRIDDPRLQLASLDHTIWFHRPFRMDEWLLFSIESPNASGGRALCFVHVYNQQGVLLATVAQEGLIRLRKTI